MYLLPFLKDGEHVVKIDKVIYDNNGNTPFLKIYFINDYGYIPHKIIINDNTKFIQKLLFKSVYLNENSPHSELTGKRLMINIERVKYENNQKITNFRNIVKKFKPLVKVSKRFIDEGEYHDLYEYNDTDSLAEIMGVNRKQVASDMGIDPSNVSESDIMDYCGY